MASTTLCFSRVVTPAYPKDEKGMPLCRFCKGEVKPPRRTICSAKCAHEIALRANTGYARAHVLDRDKGICKTCGTDTESLRLTVSFQGWERKNPFPMQHRFKIKRAYEEAAQVWRQRAMLARARLEKAAQALQAKGWPAPDRSFWEMDHVLEVVNGGGGCGLDNLQTLCVPCHKEKTRKLKRCVRV